MNIIRVCLSVIGIILCILWLLFNEHGVNWQKRYKDEARNIEGEVADGNFKIWLIRRDNFINYSSISEIIIVLFTFIYIILLTTAIINY